MNYKIEENIIPSWAISYLQRYTEEAIRKTTPYLGQPKENGSGFYWGGIDMASSLPVASAHENAMLFSIYTSNFMYDLITKYIPKPYLFNDQIVVKNKDVNMPFEPHYDNQYGPFPDDKSLLTINCMLVLDDFTDENGTIEVLDDDKWIKLYPKTGDIVLIEGNCVHRSSPNTTQQPRRAYLCVYSNKPIGQSFQKGFYYSEFTN